MELIVVLALVLLALAEGRLSASWASFYFRYGIPVFFRRVSVPTRRAPPIAEALEATIPESRWPSFTFKYVAPDVIAFREVNRQKGKVGYMPIMRGLLLIRPTHAELTVLGYANHFPLVFLALATTLIVAWTGGDLRYLGISVAIVGCLPVSLFIIQWRRFVTVARAASDLWRSSGEATSQVSEVA